MKIHLIAATVIAIALGAPAYAAPMTLPSQEAVPLTNEQLDEEFAAFDAEMAQFNIDLDAAVNSAGSDVAKMRSNAFGVIDIYEVKINTFATKVTSHLNALITAEQDPARREVMTRERDSMIQTIVALPDMIRAKVTENTGG